MLSVAMCTYNGGKFLTQQLQSILTQTLPVDEIIVCDDNSTDNTISILESFDSRFPGIIKIFRNKVTLGVKKNFEIAIGLTKGDIIFLSDQDDVWLPGKVQSLVNVFNKDENVLAVFTDAGLIDEQDKTIEGTVWSKWGFDQNIQNKWKDNAKAAEQLSTGDNVVTGATMAFRKELKNYILPFDHAHMLWHDGWISWHAASLNGLVFIKEKLVQYRIHPQQQVGIKNGVIYKKEVSDKSFFTRLKKKVQKFINEH